jgi:putative membrane protein
MGIILNLAVTAGALGIAIWIIDGLTFTGTWWQYVIVVVILGLANFIVKPILRLLSLPIILLTLGLFLVVVNALVLQLVVWLSGPSMMDLGLASTGFFWATFLGAIVLSIATWLLGIFVPDREP